MTFPRPIGNFGGMLRYLRRQAHLTQRELALAVGYTEAHICRLERNERLPDVTTVAALFAPALELEDKPLLLERLLKLAAQARSQVQLMGVTVDQASIAETPPENEIGFLEGIPVSPTYCVSRSSVLERVRVALNRERCVALCGMPGVGKTTLAAAAARQYKAAPVFWHTFADRLNTGVEAIVRQLALFLLVQGQDRVRPLVERSTEASPMPLDHQLVLLRAALAHCPALLCFDNLHLLDKNEPSLSLLRHLVAITSASFLFTSRLDVPFPIVQITLGGLEPGEARELVEHLKLELAGTQIERMLAKTGCNPMLLRLAAGQLLGRGAEETETFIEHLETQPQLTSYLLNTVLYGLLPVTQWLGALVSVFRQPVDLYDGGLSELIERAEPPGSLDDALSELQRRHLVDDVCHASLHPLVRDHLYTTLVADASRRKRLHRLAAEWLERTRGDLVEAAYHWMCAGDVEQVAELLGDQAEELINRGQGHKAAGVVEEALERIQHRRGDSAILRRRLLIARGDLLRDSSRVAEAEASYREALALAHGMPTIRAQVVYNLAKLLLQRGQSAEGLRLCQSAMTNLTAADTVLLGLLVSIESRAYVLLSRYDEAEQAAKKALSLADQFAEFLPLLADEVRARVENVLGWINYTRHPRSDDALLYYRRALDAARRSRRHALENSILSNMGTALAERGDFDNALRSFQEALRSSEALGDMYSVALAMHNLGSVYEILGELEIALHWVEQTSEIEKSIGDQDGFLMSQHARATILLQMGRLAEARTVLDSVLMEDRESADTWTLGSFLCTLGEVQLLQGEVEAARVTVQRVLAMPGVAENVSIHSWARSGLALVQMAAGEMEMACRTIAASPEDVGAEIGTRWLLVQWAVALGNGDRQGVERVLCALEAGAQRQGFRDALSWKEKMLANAHLPVSGLIHLVLTGRTENTSSDPRP